jgi:hypothetical protein
MIQANELRIGNLVTINKTALHFDGSGKDETFCISEIKEGVLQFKGFHAGEHYSSIEPIPLMEEWILKFGFKQSIPKTKIFSLGSFWIRHYGEEIGIYETRNHKKIEYVHKLQNIYFELTDKELTIK